MLEAQRTQLAADHAWIVERETKLATASARLEQAFAALRERITQWGMAGLCRANRLDEAENRRLADSRSFTEIVALVAQGMTRLTGG